MSRQSEFINVVGTLARNEYLSRDIWILPSVCIAQGALESGWNLDASTVFGIKGNGFVATTSEYYTDHYEVIRDSFKSYPDIASSVVGYYDFLRDTRDPQNNVRYSGALNKPSYVDAVYGLIYTTDGAPYATDPNYIGKIYNIIESFGLTEWDSRDTQPVVPQSPQTPTDTSNCYIVKSGDTLSEIASAHGTTYQRLAEINNILNPSLIHIGDVIYFESQQTVQPSVPQPSSQPVTSNYYVVQSGDTLSGIAASHGTTYQRLAEINNIPNPSLIHTGDVIYFEDESCNVVEQKQGITSTQEPKHQQQYIEYTVEDGDTLWGIAQKFLGDGTRYTEIQQLNGLDSTIIYIGNVLRVPQ